MRNSILLAFLIMGAFASCGKNQTKIDDRVIQEYLKENDREATLHASGIYYNIIDEGEGIRPDLLSTIEVRYKGYTTDNVVFDETTGDNTYTRNLIDNIVGWQIALPMLKTGGKGIFYIPSEMGYGENQVGSIPPNSVLIFEIELVDSWH